MASLLPRYNRREPGRVRIATANPWMLLPGLRRRTRSRRQVAFSAGAGQVKESGRRTVGHVVDSVERARVRIRVLGGVTVASLLAAVVLLIVGSPFVGRVEGESALAGNSLLQTVQDSTVVCTVRELHGKSGFMLSHTSNFTGPST